MLDADMPCLCSYRFAVTGMLQRRQQHSTAQAFAEWQLYVTARNDLRSIGARLAEQTKLNSLNSAFVRGGSSVNNSRPAGFRRWLQECYSTGRCRPLC